MKLKTQTMGAVNLQEMKENDRAILLQLGNSNRWLGISCYTGGRLVRIDPKMIVEDIEDFMKEMIAVGFSIPMIKILGGAAKQGIAYIVFDVDA